MVASHGLVEVENQDSPPLFGAVAAGSGETGSGPLAWLTNVGSACVTGSGMGVWVSLAEILGGVASASALAGADKVSCAGGGGGTLIGRMKSGRGGSGGGANSGSIAASIKSCDFSLVGVHASLRLARAGFSAVSGSVANSSAPPSRRQEADSSC